MREKGTREVLIITYVFWQIRFLNLSIKLKLLIHQANDTSSVLSSMLQRRWICFFRVLCISPLKLTSLRICSSFMGSFRSVWETPFWAWCEPSIVKVMGWDCNRGLISDTSLAAGLNHYWGYLGIIKQICQLNSQGNKKQHMQKETRVKLVL